MLLKEKSSLQFWVEYSVLRKAQGDDSGFISFIRVQLMKNFWCSFLLKPEVLFLQLLFIAKFNIVYKVQFFPHYYCTSFHFISLHISC